MIDSLNTDRLRDIRDRAIILLCAMYGLRSAEVRQLRLDDIDWESGRISIWRPKLQRRHEYPLTRTVGQSIIRYLSEGRPKSTRRELFLTLRAPYRPLSGGAVYRAVRNRFAELAIASKRRGPHSLRHACATHLVQQGLSFKEIGDHLGHRSSSATQIYAKVDLHSLRQVAALNTRGVI
ncbi:MAG: tyrosine-type recombinase/integrase [Ktedonobacteraceae bacterium]